MTLTKEQELLWKEAVNQAYKITTKYRKEVPLEYDCQNVIGTTTALVISAVSIIVAASISAYGMYAQGQAQKEVGEYNAKIQENNALTARREAEFQAKRIRDQHLRIEGTQVAAASKSGLTISGSVNDVMNDSAQESEMDALVAIYKGQAGADAQTAAARLSRFEGNSAASNATIGAAGTLIGGIGSAGGYWSMRNQTPRVA